MLHIYVRWQLCYCPMSITPNADCLPRDRQQCTTCHLTMEHCPGHIGHIELPLPVVNSLFYSTVQRLLKVTCLHCHRFKMPQSKKTLFIVQLELLDAGLINAAQTVTEMAEAKDEREEGRKKKVVVDQAADLVLVKKLTEFRDSQLLANCGETGSLMTRSIEGLRKEYTKAVMALGREGTCAHCGSVTSKLTLYKGRFIYEGLKMDELEQEDRDLQLLGARKRPTRGKGVEREKSELNPTELRSHFRTLYSSDHTLLEHLFPVMHSSSLPHPTDVLFLEVLPVPPPRSRPCQVTGGRVTQHPQSQAILAVLEAVVVMRPLVQLLQGGDLQQFSVETRALLASLRGENTSAQLDTVWKELQTHVDHVVDKDLNASKTTTTGWGFKQLIERKQGLFRMYMMGKRVNHCCRCRETNILSFNLFSFCRTVICPDPNINIDQVGIPEIFAKKLSYQVPVTHFNVAELREMVLNGPAVHPGAHMVENEDGHKVMLDPEDRKQRQGIAKTLLTPGVGAMGMVSTKQKIVYRHLVNGDPMLLNRQPTLHKPGILAHKARILKGEKVMRLHYSNCKSYNADFDGDEMNAHFPQSEVARAEAYFMVAPTHNFSVPKDGTPLQGLIQDHVIGGVKMTIRGRFFTRGEYQQWVFNALADLPGRIKLLPPAMLKPELLWSGKQIISTILINIIPKSKQPPCLEGKTKIKAKEWKQQPSRRWKAGGSPLSEHAMGESEVVIRFGELCVGVLDKEHQGNAPYGLGSLLNELYGGAVALKFFSGVSKLMTNFLKDEGFSLGVEDILVSEAANKERREIMARTTTVGDDCAAKGVGIKGSYTQEALVQKLEAAHRGSVAVPKRRADIDRGFKSALNPATNDINACCLPAGLIKKFPHNNLQLMVTSGAKGSTVNQMQISCLLGQIELEGKRPPIMVSGKSLPSFKAYDTQPRAGGFIDGRFMTGIQPQEFFFHCMAGREGLIDTACKTSRSGYLQRCLIKVRIGLVCR